MTTGLSRALLLGSTLLMLATCDGLTRARRVQQLSASPTSPPFPLGLKQSRDQALARGVEMDLEEHPELDPDSPRGAGGPEADSSQESGSYSEDADDNKPLQTTRLWVDKDNNNNNNNDTGLDRDTLTDYSPIQPQTSASPMEEPSEANRSSSASLFTAEVDALERELWEMEGASGGYALPSTAAPPLTPTAATTDSLYGLVQHPGRASTSDPAYPVEAEEEEEEEEGHTHPDDFTQSPTAPEAGAVPSVGPLQPDRSRADVGDEDLSFEDEEDEEEVVESESDGEDGIRVEEEGEEEGEGDMDRAVVHHHHTPLTTVPSPSPAPDPTVGFTEDTWDRLDADDLLTQGGEAEVQHGGAEMLSEAELHGLHLSGEVQQVICVDWSDLAGKGYVILNMSENLDCDEFRVESGDRLLELLEQAFSRKMNSPQGSWLVSLSKPTRHDRQLLMTLASEHGVIATKDLLTMLGEIRRGLHEVGVQNYTSATSCHARPSQHRSDYGKLFVVLVIIGSVCMVIITSGLVYICWQKRLPKMKTMTRGEELHFVENGCHDNPTLDVMGDGPSSEMQEKNHNTNGLAVPPGGEGGSSWKVLVNKSGQEEGDSMEEDTHL